MKIDFGEEKMMDFKPLFENEHLLLAPIDIEKDAPVESPWTADPDYASILMDGVKPMSVMALKKLYKEIRKQADEKRDLIHFMLRQKSDNRLLGCLRFSELYWAHQTGVIMLRFGSPEDFEAYAPGALRLGLRYAFEELNIYNLRVPLLAFDTPGIRLHEAAGFKLEIRRREHSFRHGRYWDQLIYVLLRPEWNAQRKEN